LEQSLPDGRKYWYNMSTTQSVWEEPAELAASRQTTVKAKVLMNSDIVSSWREILHANGRKYYYNAVTKVTMWEMPPDYAEYLERMRDPTTLDKQTAELKFMAMLKEKVHFLIKFIQVLVGNDFKVFLGRGSKRDYQPSSLQISTHLG
jgi:pre-mRNA-processing factor 40